MKTVHIDIKSTNMAGAAEYYRGLLPCRHLYKELRESGIELSIGVGPDFSKEYRGALLHCYYVADGVVHFLNRQTKGMRIGYDNDDLILELPEWHPTALQGGLKRDILEPVNLLYEYADVCSFSTERLAKWYMEEWKGNRPCKPEVFVCPNLTDLDDWRGGQKHPEDTDKIRILWCGTPTHLKDLEMLTPAVQYLAGKFRGKIEIICMGQCPPEWLMAGFPTVREIPSVPFWEYPKKLMELKPHIGLCPLIENKFAACKSNCKWMELTAAGAATVMSYWSLGKENAPYAAMGMIDACWQCENTSESWIEAIGTLITDHETRRKVHAENLAFLRDEWSWQSANWGKRDGWKRALLALGRQ